VKAGQDYNADGAPYASVSYGPLAFALAIPDIEGPNTPDPAAKWKYALADKPEAGMTIERHPMPSRWDWPLAAPLTLKAKGVPIVWDPDPKAPRLPATIAQRGPAEPITLVPYGCTKFRISMFPVAK